MNEIQKLLQELALTFVEAVPVDGWEKLTVRTGAIAPFIQVQAVYCMNGEEKSYNANVKTSSGRHASLRIADLRKMMYQLDPGKGTEKMDELRLRFLVGLSQEMIEPQKWASTNDGPNVGSWDEYNRAGKVKDKKDKIEKGDLSKIRKFVQNEGKYNETASKRYSHYSEKTGKYVPLPDENASPVEEQLTWMIDYRVKVFQKTS